MCVRKPFKASERIMQKDLRKQCLFSQASLEKIIIHKALGRVLRKALPQQWEKISPRLSTSPELFKSTESKVT